jgi:chromosomal replication initiation ATPase DnaA
MTQEIIKIVCHYFGISSFRMLERTRKHEMSHPRQIAMYLVRRYTNLSYSQIALIFGVTHSTIIYSENTVITLYSIYADFRNNLDEIEKQVKNFRRFKYFSSHLTGNLKRGGRKFRIDRKPYKIAS